MIVGSGQVSLSDVNDGKSGSRVAELKMYKWSALPPTTFPSGTSSYSWADASFTDPATLNGWSKTPGTPVAGQTLYACSVTYVEAL